MHDNPILSLNVWIGCIAFVFFSLGRSVRLEGDTISNDTNGVTQCSHLIVMLVGTSFGNDLGCAAEQLLPILVTADSW